MPYCSVEEAWGKNFQKSVKPPKRVTPPRPKICDYKIEEGVVGAPDTGAYASFKTGGGGAASRERFSTRMEPVEYQRGEGLNNVETNIDVGGPITDSFIENLYYSKQKTNEEPSPYSLLNSANANVVRSNNHLQDQDRK